MSLMIDVFDYDDFRLFLKAACEEQRKESKRFSLRHFAELAGFNSSGYMTMVMKGERNLSPSSISKISEAFKMSRQQSEYFEALVLCNQAKDPKESDYYRERLQRLKLTSRMVFDDLPSGLKDFSSLTVSVPKDCLDEFGERVREFRDDVMTWLNSQSGQYDEVFQMSMQFCPANSKDQR
ncbi:MAG: TIGR02147 family protein [Deltaproteobacteria bacterium]|nr:TIGR02147 family protein [Deltaproteobacteria bacterium]